jgi:hypothetical protein
MQAEADAPIDPGSVAAHLAQQLDERGIEYALGGAIALGFWARPRGTVDVDLTLFFAPEKASEVVWYLQQIGCDVKASRAIASLREHGFCRVAFAARQVDVFVATNSFYESAKARRRRVHLGDREVTILDAETLAVFKMMFFRPQDIVDLRKILQVQGDRLDRGWVRDHLLEIVGPLDPRIAQWDELVNELPS